MLSEVQKIERLSKFKKILNVIDSCKNISEISSLTNIPTSTIQRYLNNKPLFYELFGDESFSCKGEQIEKLYSDIQLFLHHSKENGLKNGGLRTQELHGYEKDSIGRFKGSRKCK